DLVENAPGLDVCRPLLDATFAATHADFERLLRHRPMGVHANPELAGALDVTLDRHARGFDLPRGQPPGLEALHRIVAEGHVAAALRDAAIVALLHLAVLGSF